MEWQWSEIIHTIVPARIYLNILKNVFTKVILGGFYLFYDFFESSIAKLILHMRLGTVWRLKSQTRSTIAP